MAHLGDTNLLLRAAQDGHPQQAEARDAIRDLIVAGEDVFLMRQNLVEFWVVATRPADRNGLAMTPEQAEAELARLENQFPVLPDTDAVYDEWRRLVTTHGVTGFRSYDARLVASMLVHGVTHILTFNVEDFRRYPGIVVVHPQDAVPPAAPAD